MLFLRLVYIFVLLFSDLDPFLSAIWRGDAKALQDFIHSKSKNLEEPNKDGWIPLHECAYNGHVECLKVLLKGEKSIISRLCPVRNQTLKTSCHSLQPNQIQSTKEQTKIRPRSCWLLVTNTFLVSSIFWWKELIRTLQIISGRRHCTKVQHSLISVSIWANDQKEFGTMNHDFLLQHVRKLMKR